MPVILAALAACEVQGLSGRNAEWSRQASGDFFVVSASHDGAVISARGNQIAVEPAPGFCLAEDSLETSPRSIFALIGDCVIEGPGPDAAASAAAAKDGLALPRAIPGIITVSISGDRGYRQNGSGEGSLAGLEAFLRSPEGRSMLGRGGASSTVSIGESRQIDGALYVYVEDSNAEIVPVLGADFWRAFVELNERMTVVTISGFRDRPLGKEAMLSYLVSQIQTLVVANATPILDGATRYASATDRVTTVPVRPLRDADLADVVVATARMPNGRLVPLPPLRPRAPGRSDPEAEAVRTPGTGGMRFPVPKPSATPEAAVVVVAAPATDDVAAPVDGAVAQAPSADVAVTAPDAEDTPPVADAASEPAVVAATSPDPAALDEPADEAVTDTETVSTSRLAPKNAPPAPLRPGGG